MRFTTRRALGVVLTIVLGASVLVASPASSAAGFGDVDESRYYAEPVQWMVDNDITTGTSEGCFSPDRDVTRGELAVFMWRIAGEPNGGAEPFGDVGQSAYYHDAVAWMVNQGITTGTSDTTFHPSRPVTRGEAGTFMWRWAGEPAGGSEPFTDVQPGRFYSTAVAWMVNQGITNGTSDTTFHPERSVTRGEVAAFLFRMNGSGPVAVDPGGSCGGSSGGGGGGGGGTTAHFETLPPGSDLPSGAECATRVRPAPEIRQLNIPYNNRPGIGANDWDPRIDGDFVGTTDEILQWVACKWGIDEDIVRAQAIKESYWFMDTMGDNIEDGEPQSWCHPDIRGPNCAESVGMFQVRYRYHGEAFENDNALYSTAYNADYTYAIWRACYEGDWWEGGSEWVAGDVWACLGSWYTGSWYPAIVWPYLNDIQSHLDNRTWETPAFIAYQG